VTFEVTCDIGHQTVIDRGLHCIDEVKEPDAIGNSC
jgi:hypothetical protein